MTDTTITNMPAGSAIVDADLFCMDQGGVSTNKNPASAIKTYIGAVSGPASSTDKAIVRWNGTTGKIVQDYTSNPPTITDTGQVFIGPSGIPPATIGTAFNTFATDLNANVVLNSFQSSGTLNASGNLQALQFNATDTGSNNVNQIQGINGLAIKSVAGTIGILTAVQASARINGTVTATTVSCFLSQPRFNAAGCSATSVINFSATAASSGGTVTNCYGLKVVSQKVAGVTNGYGVACDGTTDLNYFLGSTGLGVIAPTAYAHCAASTAAKASLRIAAGTAPTSPNDGDIWYDGTNFKAQVAGVTKTFTLV